MSNELLRLGRHPALIAHRSSLARALSGYLRAYQLQAALLWALRLLALGLALDLVALALARAWPQLAPPAAALALPPLLGIVVGAGLGLARRPGVEWLASQVDRRLGLQERTVTALELIRHSRSSPQPPTSNPQPPSTNAQLVDEQLADSIHHLRRAEPQEAFPFRVPRREVAAVLALAVAIVPLTLIAPPARLGQVGPRLDGVARGEAERITALAEEIGREEPLDESPETNGQVAQTLREAGDELRQAAADPDRAMAQLSGAERKLASMQSPRAFDTAAALSRIADALDRDARTRPVASALDRRDYRRAADEMRQLGSRAAGAPEADRQAMAQALRQGGAAAGRYDEKLAEALRQAADRAAAGEAGSTDQAAREMARTGGQMQRQETLERALSQLQNSRQALGAGSRQGQSGSSSSASRRPSAGQEPGEGEGSGRDQGQGQRQGQGQGQGQGDGNGERPGSGAGTGSTGRTTELYDPAAVRTRQVQVPGGDFDRPQISVGDSQTDGGDGEARVDYRDVLPTYQERATRAMQDRYIPLGMKELVKQYFSSLQPDGTRR
ncbi:MAG TPA: hypothetical protein VGL23_14715 [Chloroflexota bacterium]